MKTYLYISNTVIFISFVIFTIINKGILIENVDPLVTNILVLHIEFAFVNFGLAKLVYWIIKRDSVEPI